MEGISKIKDWIQTNAPMLANLYQNKYVGMLYDRFASLPAKRQRNVLLGGLAGGAGIIAIFIFWFYWSLWSDSARARQSSEMVHLLLQYQKTLQEKSSELRILEQNKRFAEQSGLKDYLMSQARMASISPRMTQVNELSSAADAESQDIQIRKASIILDKINLAQLKNYLSLVEYGLYSLRVTGLKITNDDKMRGYMKAEITVSAYLFAPPTEAGT